MKTPTKFVKELTEAQRQELNAVMNTGNRQLRTRAHTILLSSRKFSIDEIANIYEVDRDTVSLWLDRWEKTGLDGLKDQAGRGRPQILNEKEQAQAIRIVEQDPRSTKSALPKIEEKTKKKISAYTLKRLLKKSGKVWKRIRRSLRDKRDEADFQGAKAQLGGFRAQAATGEIDLFYFDEAGFTLNPSLSYAWQTVGQTIEIPATTSDRINVLGFYNTENCLHPDVFRGTTTSQIVIACFDQFSQKLDRPTLLVIDGASIHTSEAFQAKLPEWEERDLYVYLLPAYSPELNLIEILWRMIKYKWLPLDSYESFKKLLKRLEEVLKGVGSKYQINFAH